MKKRILSFILSIILILSVWPGTSVSAESPYAYTVTPQLTKATIDYLNEILLGKAEFKISIYTFNGSAVLSNGCMETKIYKLSWICAYDD